MRKKLSIYIFIIFTMILLGGLISIAYGDNVVGYYPPQPKDTVVLVSKPNISMQFILNGNKVQSFDMQMNGKKVEAKFDEEAQSIYYLPAENLKAGNYKISLSVKFEGWTNSLEQSWEFRVGEKTLGELPSPTEEQKLVLNYINNFRKFAGLSPLQLNDALNAAAVSHSNYMAANKKITHEQFVNDKGFIGEGSFKRAGAFGYKWGYVVENLSFGQKDYKESIEGLINAPYHRLIWLNPYVRDLGYGVKDNYFTYKLGGKKVTEDKLVVYPIENQANVPTSWDGNETPNPLRFYSTKGDVGYPISLSYFSGKNVVKFTVEEAKLTNSKNNPVAIYLNTPEKDNHLQESILIIPSSPLAKGELYSVYVKGKLEFQDKTTKVIEKTWKFNTADSTENKTPRIKNMVFSDIENHWAKSEILDLGEKNILSAKTNDLYKPEDQITRAEFAEIISNVLSLEEKEFEGIFKDVNINTSKAIDIESVFRAGVVSGTGDSTFSPNKVITREELATMIIRAYGKTKDISGLLSLSSFKFADQDQISPWALEAVKASYELGIIKGRDNNRFVPKASATRAEAAVMVKKLLEKL